MGIENSPKNQQAKGKPANNAMRTARKSLGMTQEDAAAAIGVTKGSYFQWEKGRLKPRPDKAEKIAQTLHLPLEQIPVSGKHKPHSVRRVMKTYDKAQLARMEKYTPYRERRIELGLTQDELAKKAGVTPTVVSQIERGDHEPYWETRQKIRRALGWPEECRYTVEERNTEFLRMENIVHWVLQRNRESLLAAGVDLEDAYQDLAVCALRAIDRFDPAGSAKIENYLICQMMQHVKNIRRLAVAKGICYGDGEWPSSTILSLEHLVESGIELEAA